MRTRKNAETAYRELLKQYPGNEIIFANLLYVLQKRNKNEELIELCKTVVASAKLDEIRYDAARIMAETYRKMGEYTLCKNAIDLIPEFFFTHREEKAILLEGEDMFRPAWQQKIQSLDSLLWMTLRLADYYESSDEKEKAKRQLFQARDVINLFQNSEHPPFWKEDEYQLDLEKWNNLITKRIENIQSKSPLTVCPEDYIFTRFS